MYILGLIIIILKGIIFFFNTFLFKNFSLIHLILIIFLITCYFTIKYYKKREKLYYKKIFEGTKETLTDHIMTYRFKNGFRIFITVYFLFTIFIIYIVGILSLRIQNLSNIIDLKIMKNFIIHLYFSIPLSLFLCNILIILSFILLLLQTIGIIKKLLLILVIKLHFLCSMPGSDYTNKISDLAFSNYLYRIDIFFFLLSAKIAGLIYKDDENLSKIFIEKYKNFFEYIYNIIYYIIYYGHFLIFICLFVYDIIFNNMILYYTVYYLPIMFIYNLYVIYCNFVHYRRTFGLIEFVNRIFYGEVVVINDKLIFIDGDPYEVDDDFGKEFLEFEFNNFKIP